MEQSYFWNVKVKLRGETSKGTIKYTTEVYLVRAISPTDAEATITLEFANYPEEWYISGVTQTRIIKVLDESQ